MRVSRGPGLLLPWTPAFSLIHPASVRMGCPGVPPAGQSPARSLGSPFSNQAPGFCTPGVLPRRPHHPAHPSSPPQLH